LTTQFYLLYRVT